MSKKSKKYSNLQKISTIDRILRKEEYIKFLEGKITDTLEKYFLDDYKEDIHSAKVQIQSYKSEYNITNEEIEQRRKEKPPEPYIDPGETLYEELEYQAEAIDYAFSENEEDLFDRRLNKKQC